jgi:glycosyltransferase involved in cell wall biosynthesis
MSPRTTHGVIAKRGELLDMVLPHRTGTSSIASPVEAQYDHLIDLLAADQAMDVPALDAPALDSFAFSVGGLDEPQSADDSCTDAARDEVFATSFRLSNKTLELSVVIPCLDEADTVGNCVVKARQALNRMGVAGEVIVADNGSRDRSVQIAEELGARVVHVEERGYGAALMGGIEAAKGRFIIMADADDSYDFTQLNRFYERLCEGADLVQGCRLPSGGGKIMPGAMPLLHRLGNPALTWLVRKMFHAPVKDVYCGMRGFRRELYMRLDQRCTGMEFATEMIVKSTLFGARISEIPITLYKDGRRSHRPHLRTFHDGWKTLRYFLLQSPRWTFLAPAAMLAVVGLVGYVLVFARLQLGTISLDVHSLLVATLAVLVAFQVAACGVLAKVFAGFEGLLPLDERLERLSHTFTLERCLVISAGLVLGGVGAIAWKANAWMASGFGALDYAQTMRVMIPAVGAIALGVQAASSSFLLSVLRLRRR